MTGVQNFALGTGYKRPMDLDFGPDGALYVIEWGSGFNGNNADSGVYRVDYIAGDKARWPRAMTVGRRPHDGVRGARTPPLRSPLHARNNRGQGWSDVRYRG